MKVSIVIPNFNGEDLLRENIPFILTARDCPGNDIGEIIVVDDGSTDESVNLLKKNFPDIKLIKHRINRGFSAAVNTGARFSKGKLIVLLNSDVRPEKDFLVAALPHFENRKVFAVSLHEKGYGAAIGIFKDGFIVHEPGKEDSSKHLTFWVSGGSGVFRRDIWMELGGMDEKLLSPAYWEDLDLCYRALKRGYKLIWEPNARVSHEHESTISKLSTARFRRIKERNQLLFVWKNLTSLSLFRKHVSGLFKRLVKSPGYIRIVLMALGKIRDVARLRKKEKKETRISDEAIFASFTK